MKTARRRGKEMRKREGRKRWEKGEKRTGRKHENGGREKWRVILSET